MDALTYQALRRTNPWLEDPSAFPDAPTKYLPTPWLDRTHTLPDDAPAHLLVGARQVGKSSLVWRKLVAGPLAPLFINADELSIRAWARSPSAVAEGVATLVPPGAPLFFEEAQRLDDAGLLIKGLVDLRVPHPIFVTGSSAFHLQARHRESLAGRASRSVLHPFSLKEVCHDLADRPSRVASEEARKRASKALVFGGYPKVHLSETPAVELNRLVEAIIVRDASDLFRVQDLEAFRMLQALVASQVGDLVNVSEWASISGVSRDTIRHYLQVLADSHVVKSVRPYVGGKRAELTGRPKVYFCDNGIRNAVRGGFAPLNARTDVGALFESWVFSELHKRLSPFGPTTLHYWRTKSGAEVDFVLAGPDQLTGIEVKATRLKRPKLTRSARSFIDAYAPDVYLVVNQELVHHERVGDTDVHWVGPEVFAFGAFDALARP